ncbi:MAG TPA: 3-keto-5-aminohexanoate cleavage protein [Thermoleophilaceae bacterium]
MLIQACLNGARRRGEHPFLPLLLDELVRDARACARAGATSLHVHPRDGAGKETLDPGLVDTAAGAMRAGAGIPVGVTTGAWIEPDPERRAALVSEWTSPNFASLNLYEEGFEAVAWALLDTGIEIEAGIETEADVERLVASGLANRVLRVLIEVVDEDPEEAARHALELDRALDAHGVGAPRLHHGSGDATWAVIAQAGELGRDLRIGLEDVLTLPNGDLAPDNAALVGAAVAVRRAA